MYIVTDKTWLTRRATTFSVALETNLRFETDLKFLWTSWSSEFFISIGSKTASVKLAGIVALSKDRLIMPAITGYKMV